MTTRPRRPTARELDRALVIDARFATARAVVERIRQPRVERRPARYRRRTLPPRAATAAAAPARPSSRRSSRAASASRCRAATPVASSPAVVGQLDRRTAQAIGLLELAAVAQPVGAQRARRSALPRRSPPQRRGGRTSSHRPREVDHPDRLDHRAPGSERRIVVAGLALDLRGARRGTPPPPCAASRAWPRRRRRAARRARAAAGSRRASARRRAPARRRALRATPRPRRACARRSAPARRPASPRARGRARTRCRAAPAPPRARAMRRRARARACRARLSRQLDREVDAGHRGDARQLQVPAATSWRSRRSISWPDAGRPRQRARVERTPPLAIRCLIVSSAYIGLPPVCRVEQRRELRRVERRRGRAKSISSAICASSSGASASTSTRCASSSAARSASTAADAFGRPLREAPAQPGEVVGEHQALQHLEAGRVGEVQVVDDQRGQPGAMRVEQQRTRSRVAASAAARGRACASTARSISGSTRASSPRAAPSSSSGRRSISARSARPRLA